MRPFLDDLEQAPETIAEDLRDLLGDPGFHLSLGATWLAGRAMEGRGVERWADEQVFEPDLLSADLSHAFDEFGEGHVLLGGASLMYLHSRSTEGPVDDEVSKRLLRSLATTGIVTTAIKLSYPKRRPNGGRYAYPSGHTSMTFALATSLGESYGPAVGVPLALLSLGTAFQRVDSGAHDLSDVLGGMVLGVYAAQSVGGRADAARGQFFVTPFVDERSRAAGLRLNWSF